MLKKNADDISKYQHVYLHCIQAHYPAKLEQAMQLHLVLELEWAEMKLSEHSRFMFFREVVFSKGCGWLPSCPWQQLCFVFSEQHSYQSIEEHNAEDLKIIKIFSCVRFLLSLPQQEWMDSFPLMCWSSHVSSHALIFLSGSSRSCFIYYIFVPILIYYNFAYS